MNYDDNEKRGGPAPHPARVSAARRRATLVALLAEVYLSAGLRAREARAAALADYVCSFSGTGRTGTSGRAATTRSCAACYV